MVVLFFFFFVHVVLGQIFFLRFVGMDYLFVWRGYVVSCNVWFSYVAKEFVSLDLEVLYYVREETTFKTPLVSQLHCGLAVSRTCHCLCFFVFLFLLRMTACEL